MSLLGKPNQKNHKQISLSAKSSQLNMRVIIKIKVKRSIFGPGFTALFPQNYDFILF